MKNEQIKSLSIIGLTGIRTFRPVSKRRVPSFFFRETRGNLWNVDRFCVLYGSLAALIPNQRRPELNVGAESERLPN